MIKTMELIKHSSFGKNALIYMVASLFSAALSFVMVTVLTKLLTPADIGIIENFTALSALLTSIVLWGGNTVIINYYSNNETNQYKLVLNGLIVQSILLLTLTCFYKFSFFEINRTILFIAVGYSIFNALYTVIITSFQLEKKAMMYAFVVVGFAALNTVVSIFLVLKTGDYFGRIISFLIVTILILIGLSFNFIKSKLKGFSINMAYIKECYSVGLILVVGQVISWMLEKIDRFMITDMLSIEDAGIYGVGYQFGMIVLVLQSAISRAWMPYVIDKVRENNRDSISKAIKYLSLFLICFSILVSIASYFYIIYIIDDRFSSAAVISIIVCIGYCLDGLWKLYNGILVYENMFRFYTIVVFIAGIINVLLNFFTIPIWGMYGAAIATVMSFFCGFIVSSIYVHRGLVWFKKKV